MINYNPNIKAKKETTDERIKRIMEEMNGVKGDMKAIEAEEKPGEESKEPEAYQELEEQLGVEKHQDEDSAEEASEPEHQMPMTCPHCGKDISETEEPEEMEDEGNKPGLFDKSPKVAIMIASKKGK